MRTVPKTDTAENGKGTVCFLPCCHMLEIGDCPYFPELYLAHEFGPKGDAIEALETAFRICDQT